MSFIPMQKVIWTDTKPNDIYPTIHCGVVVKSTKTETKLQGEDFPRYTAFLYPDTQECRDFLIRGIELVIRHKMEQEAHYVQTLEFNNQLVRTGQK